MTSIVANEGNMEYTVESAMHEITISITKKYNEQVEVTGAILTKSEKINEVTKIVQEIIESEVVGTGKIITIDIMDIIEQNLLALEDAPVAIRKLISILESDNKVVFKQKSKFVYTFECTKKIIKILSLNKLQKIVYELYPMQPEVAKLGFKKMTPEERTLMEEVLKFER